MDGIKKLLASSKGVLALVVFAGSLLACLLGKLDGTPFSLCVGTVYSIFAIARAHTDSQVLKAGK